jgi:cytochrome c oxidase subunit I+III
LATTDARIGNTLPRPEKELEQLERVWQVPKGIGKLTAVNNTFIGTYYIGTAFLFFILAGILALIMRTQLAVPENELVDSTTYNQLFTTHGTVMMFLFAVPIVEAMAVYILPGMLAARDLPFPRLSAYAFWAYFIGGSVFFCSLFFGLAPDGGWFIYPPLTLKEFSPGDNIDFWLLGIGSIEISAIAGAIELVVGSLRTRAPGMTLGRMPVYAWAMLVVAGMIIFGFPPVIAGSLLLEIERSFGWPFFNPDKGGDPLLWQHLFWLFGHPEVYIIFLPGAAMISMIIPTMARVPLVGYGWVVMALVATGFLSFGLWVHHMFATGLPVLSLSFFSAASMAVVIPSGIQVFSWIATLGAGRPSLKDVPTLFVFGTLFIFVLGGLTGVMVAVVPFNWQVHDSYFVVAHLHYVLIGGLVFPIFAAFYYWMPNLTGRMMSPTLGKWVFWLMFAGFNIAFLPMHLTGLRGMPRRVYTYPAEMGFDLLNLVSTAGAFMLAVGVAVFLVDLVTHLWRGKEVGDNPWNAGTLEWLPQGLYANRSIPFVESREPLWDRPQLAREVEMGAHFLPGAPTGFRETIVTSPVDARPQYIMQMPGPSWWPLLAAAGTAFFFIMLTIKVVWPAFIGVAIAIVAIIAWLWELDPGHYHEPVDVGFGVTLPVSPEGRVSHSYWGMVVLLLAGGTTFTSLAFGYLFLWTVNPGEFPPAGTPLPRADLGAAAAALYTASAVALWLMMRAARRGWNLGLSLFAVAALLLVLGAFAADLGASYFAGLDPAATSFGAVTYAIQSYQGLHIVIVLFMAFYLLARNWAGLIAPNRMVTVDNIVLFWRYTTVQGVLALGLLHFGPRLLGS